MTISFTDEASHGRVSSCKEKEICSDWFSRSS